MLFRKLGDGADGNFKLSSKAHLSFNKAEAIPDGASDTRRNRAILGSDSQKSSFPIGTPPFPTSYRIKNINGNEKSFSKQKKVGNFESNVTICREKDECA